MWSHFFVDRSEKGTKFGARKLLTTSWESSWIHFIIWQDVMEKIYKISWCCRNQGCLNGNQSITALISWKCCFPSLDGQFSANTSTDCHRIGFFICFFLRARCAVIVTTESRYLPTWKSESHCLMEPESCLMKTLIDWLLSRFSMQSFSINDLLGIICWHFTLLQPNMTSHVLLIG